MILAIRTDSPQAVIQLWSGGEKLAEKSWEAGRQLSAQLLPEISRLLDQQKAAWGDLAGIVVFRGPGSFTGLRIGVTVANTIAYAQHIPIVGTQGEQWAQKGADALAGGRDDKQVVPEYGAPANITKPRQ